MRDALSGQIIDHAYAVTVPVTFKADFIQSCKQFVIAHLFAEKFQQLREQPDIHVHVICAVVPMYFSYGKSRGSSENINFRI